MAYRVGGVVLAVAGGTIVAKRRTHHPKRVKIFTTPACSWCRVAKAYLRDNDIEFTEIDISTDFRGRREMVAMTGQYGVPVVLVGEKAIVGWNPTEFERLLRH